MKSVRTILAICMQNIRKWNKDYRVWSVAVLVLIMIKIYINDFHDLCGKLHSDMPIWIFPFIYSQYYMKVIFTIPLLLLFCNAPFIDNNQIYVYIRSGRTKWLLGQLTYIFFASAIYYLFIIVATFVLMSLSNTSYSLEWGKVLKTIAEVDMSGLGNFPFIQVSDMVIRCFTPIQAVIFTFLVSWSNAILLGTVIFTFNYLFRNKYIGVTIASFGIAFSFFVEIAGYPDLINYSPTSWITLDKIDIGGRTAYPSFYYCMIVYWAIIATLVTAVLVFGRKKEIDNRR